MSPLRRLLDAESDRDFGAALSDLRHALGMGYDEFAREVSRHHPQGKTWSKSYLNQVELGRQQIAKSDSMVALAQAAAKVAQISPTYFRDYREHLAAQRAKQAARNMGLDRVLAVLDELDRPKRKR